MKHFLADDTPETLTLRDNLRTLLHSHDSDNVWTALEMLQSGGVPKSLLDDVLYAYLLSLDMPIRARIQTLLLESPDLSDFSKRYFKTYLEQPWVGLSGSELTIRKRIKKYLERSQLDFSPIHIAKLLYQKNKQGYFYILEDGSTEDKLELLKNAIIDKKLILNGLKDLFRLPLELSHFADIKEVHLRGCGFRVFPKVLLSYPFSALELVDLRQNPLTEIPAKAHRHLSNCRFLT